MKFVFNAEDIFEEIDGDPDNVVLKFPPEIMEQAGWKPGDVVNISAKDGSIVIKKNA